MMEAAKTDIARLTVVLGGGGVWGIGWMTGILMGLMDEGMDLRDAGGFVGTSAGAVIAAQLAGALSIADLFARQTDPARQVVELTPPPDCLAAIMAITRRSWVDDRERLSAICTLAKDAKTVTVAQRQASMADRLMPLGRAWPVKPLMITAVNADTMALRSFDAHSNVSQIDAVAASCAVPGVWPPVPIDGGLYVDGGVWRTAENAHLAHGASSVLILSPLGRSRGSGEADGAGVAPALASDIAELRTAGAKVVLIAAEEACLATMAAGPLDPASRAPAALAGRAQGVREAAMLRRMFVAVD